MVPTVYIMSDRDSGDFPINSRLVLATKTMTMRAMKTWNYLESL